VRRERRGGEDGRTLLDRTIGLGRDSSAWPLARMIHRAGAAPKTSGYGVGDDRLNQELVGGRPAPTSPFDVSGMVVGRFLGLPTMITVAGTSQIRKTG
jgi:hypothetical protein